MVYMLMVYSADGAGTVPIPLGAVAQHISNTDRVSVGVFSSLIPVSLIFIGVVAAVCESGQTGKAAQMDQPGSTSSSRK